jgi:hypothetical protein
MTATDDRLIAGVPADEDLTLDTTLRPPSLEEYIGQESVKANLRVAVDASLAMLMPKPSPTRCIKVSRPTPWRSIEGLRPNAVVRRTI